MRRRTASSQGDFCDEISLFYIEIPKENKYCKFVMGNIIPFCEVAIVIRVLFRQIDFD